MERDTQRADAIATNPASRPPTPGAQWVTWTISGAAVIVTLAAGALLLGEKETLPTEVEPEDVDSDPTETPSLPQLTKRGPLDLSASHLDAQQRARIWNEAAMLSGMSLVIEDGKPISAIEFSFGVSTGPTTPGAPLGDQRYVVSYEGSEVSATEEEDPKRRVAISPPNCTLDAAYRVLIQAGVPRISRVGVILLQSEKHQRPVWLMTTSEGNAYSINAESCVLLRR